MKRIKLNDYKTQFNALVNTIFSTIPFNTLTAYVRQNAKARIIDYFNVYSVMGLTFIGEWSEETEFSDMTDFIKYFFERDFHYFRSLNEEFVIKSPKSVHTTGTHSSNVTKTASELSPVDSAVIGTSPVSTDTWDIKNPNSKSGGNYVGDSQTTEETTNPQMEKLALELNVSGMNLDSIAKRVVRSFVEEFNMAY